LTSIAIPSDNVENNTPKKEGVKGILPLGCFPDWGREGVTLITASRELSNDYEKRVSTEPLFL